LKVQLAEPAALIVQINVQQYRVTYFTTTKIEIPTRSLDLVWGDLYGTVKHKGKKERKYCKNSSGSLSQVRFICLILN
jgi:hypothetical protein